MRRVVLFSTLLLLLGLSTAFAASFSVEAEDVASFTTDVSISVPAATPVPNTIYIRGSGTDAAGQLLFEEPADNVPTTDRALRRDTESVQEQQDPLAFYTWIGPTAPPNGYLLSGTATLVITQNESGTERLTAGLLDCAASAPPASSDTTQCSLLAVAASDALTGSGAGGNGYKDRTVHFGSIGPVTIASGRQLRLKIVNRGDVSTKDFSISWGFNPARTSLLTIT